MSNRPPMPTVDPPMAPNILEPEIEPNIQINNLILPINVNRNNFPTAANLNIILTNINFNQLLCLIKDKIIAANIVNINYIRLLYIEIINFTENIITNVKTFLIEHGYEIILIEDINNNNIGFKIKW